MEKQQKLYQISEIRRLENLAIEQYHITEETLMHRAGEAAFQDLRLCWPNVKKVLVVCGKGNNGGDGYVFAHMAKNSGFDIKIRYVEDLPKLDTHAWSAYQTCLNDGIEIQSFQEHESWDADVIVDAILGIGIESDVKNTYRDAILKINACKKEVLAIDVPSGLHADTGNINGVAVKASVTSTFIALKCGLFTAFASQYCGKIFCHDLSIPKEAFQKIKTTATIISEKKIKRVLPPRSKNSHKGNFGHVLIIGGYYGMAGAARLSAEAALRVGTGRVSVATLPEHASVICSGRPEIMCYAVTNSEELLPLLHKATVIVIGPGLGKEFWGQALLLEVLKSEKPKILDADALNLLSDQPVNREDWILTPHPGEASRLLSCSIEEIQKNRFHAVENLQKKYSGVCVLKGAGTLVKGKSDTIRVCNAGNPGMASAGMGLQEISPPDADQAIDLLVPIFEEGQLIYQSPALDEIRQFCLKQRENFYPTRPYSVYIDHQIKALEKKLIAEINFNRTV